MPIACMGTRLMAERSVPPAPEGWVSGDLLVQAVQRSCTCKIDLPAMLY